MAGSAGKLLLTASAAFLLALGFALNFAPKEMAAVVGSEGGSQLPWELLAGALIGLGLMNGMSRSRPFGGVYGRPLGLANVLLFVVGAFALGRAATGAEAPPSLWVLFVVYAVLAVAFVWVVFKGGPVLPKGASE